MTGQERAEACAASLFASDRATQALGMVIQRVAPGSATLTMKVTETMLNGHGTCHGGMIFSLADSAFAFACNSRNTASVAQHCAITFHSPARGGEILTATATELTLAGRFGVTDVIVHGGDGRVVATFRGNSAAIKGSVLP
jgi:acyl-CoA thioesterase